MFRRLTLEKLRKRLQVLFKQHGFELRRSTYACIFFFFPTNIQSALCIPEFYIWELMNLGLKTVFSIYGWKSKNAEGLPHALFQAILYKGLEHPRILVSAGGNQSPADTKGWLYLSFWGVKKLYVDFQLCRGSACLTSTLSVLHD